MPHLSLANGKSGFLCWPLLMGVEGEPQVFCGAQSAWSGYCLNVFWFARRSLVLLLKKAAFWVGISVPLCVSRMRASLSLYLGHMRQKETRKHFIVLLESHGL